MKSVLAVLGLELRLMRRDLLLGGALMIAVVAGVLAGEARGDGALLPMPLRAGVLVVLVLVGIVRVASMDESWAGLRAALPVTTSRLVLSRLLLWAALAVLPACAYVLWATAPPWEPLKHVLTVWLWILVAGLGWSQGTEDRGTASRAADAVLGGGTLLLLGGTLPATVSGGDAWVGIDLAPWLLGGLLVAHLVYGLASEAEWLPSQSPKELRLRSRWVGGLIKRPSSARSTRAVLGHLGVRRISIGRLTFALLLYGTLLFLLMHRIGRTRGVQGEQLTPIFLVVGIGLFVSLQLKKTVQRWAFLRTFPLPRSAVWGWPITTMAVVAASWFGLFALTQFYTDDDRLAGNAEVSFYTSHQGGAGRLPALYTPVWAFADGVTRDRPAGMPAPESGDWALRASFAPHLPGVVWRGPGGVDVARQTDEQTYFLEALHYYLSLVHGVEVSDEELIAALGDPFFFDEDTTELPVGHYLEHVWSRGYGLSSYPPTAGSTTIRVEVQRPLATKEEDYAMPSAMFSYAAALERLQVRLGDRLAHAARLRTILDLCVLLLSTLLFIRLTLLGGPMRFALPLLAFLPVGLWYGGRATHLARFLRDAHLAQWWVAPSAAIVLAVLLLISIRRQVGRMEPSSFAGVSARP